MSQGAGTVNIPGFFKGFRCVSQRFCLGFLTINCRGVGGWFLIVAKLKK